MKSVLFLLLASVQILSAACPASTVQITGTLLNPDGSGFSGRLIPFLGYTIPTARENRVTITVTAGVMTASNNGGLVCLAPASYTVANYVGNSQLSYSTYWVVPSSGPVGVVAIESTFVPTPSLFVAPSSITPGTNGQVLTTVLGAAAWAAAAGGAGTWGSITGTLSNQLDLASALAAKQASLGYVPANVASNLSDLTNTVTARSNLGLGTAATQATGAFDAAGAAAAAQAAAIAASAPASPVNSVQTNNAGVLGGSSVFTFDGSQAHIGVAEAALPPEIQGWTGTPALLATHLNDGLGIGVEVGGSGNVNGVTAAVEATVDGSGVQANMLMSGNGAAAKGLVSYTEVEAGVAALTNYGVWVQSIFLNSGASLTNQYGLRIDDQNAAANNWAIKTGLGKVEFGDAVTAPSFAGPLTGNASTATALAANPTNCSAGNYPLGIDASGNAESCTAAATGNALTANPLSQFAATTSAQLAGVVSDESGTGLLLFNGSPVIVTPTIASFANATHNHSNAAGGGTVSYADLTSKPTIPTVTGGTCTNQVATAISGSAVPTCTTITSAYVDSSIVSLTGSQTVTNKTLTTPIIGQINDANGNASIINVATASAVDQLTVTNSATAAHNVTLSPTGSDTNISLTMLPKGTGTVGIGVAPTAGYELYIKAPSGNADLGLESNGHVVDFSVTTAGTFALWDGSAFRLAVDANSVKAGSAQALGFANSTGADQPMDTALCRDAAGVVSIYSTTCGTTSANYRDVKLRHELFSGTAPTLTAGTGTIAGADGAGRVTLTAGAQTSITVTFGTAFTTAPVCVANDDTTSMLVQAQPTTTTVVLKAVAFGSADVIGFHCIGY